MGYKGSTDAVLLTARVKLRPSFETYQKMAIAHSNQSNVRFNFIASSGKQSVFPVFSPGFIDPFHFV